jgi:hypothetical protein
VAIFNQKGKHRSRCEKQMTHIGKIDNLKLESHLRNAFRIASKHFTYKTVIIIMKKLNNLLVSVFKESGNCLM